MNKNLVWIFVCLCLFAAGYIGISLLRQQQAQQIQNGPAPALPSTQ